MTSPLCDGDSHPIKPAADVTPSAPCSMLIRSDGEERRYAPSSTTIGTDSTSVTPSSSARDQVSHSDCSSSVAGPPTFHQLIKSATTKPRGLHVELPSSGGSTPSSSAIVDATLLGVHVDALLTGSTTPKRTSMTAVSTAAQARVGKPYASRKHKHIGPSGQRIKVPDIRNCVAATVNSDDVQTPTSGSECGSVSDWQQQQPNQTGLSPVSSVWTKTSTSETADIVCDLLSNCSHTFPPPSSVEMCSSDASTPRSDLKSSIDSARIIKTDYSLELEKPSENVDEELSDSMKDRSARSHGDWNVCASQQQIAGKTRSSVGTSTGTRGYLARHSNDYKNCVTTEPDAVRMSRRERESTQAKLFGKADSPRPKKTPVTMETTQDSLFGPPPKVRPPSRTRGYSDTHQSLFGPAPSAPRRQNSARLQDAPDLLSQTPPLSTRNGDDILAMKGRYPLRHENTANKLFGEQELSSAASSPPNSARNSPMRVVKARESCPVTKISPTYKSVINHWNDHAEECSSRPLPLPPTAEPVSP